MSVAVEGVASTELSILMRRSTGWESVQQIIDSTATAEALAVPILGVALESAADGRLPRDAAHKQVLRAGRAGKKITYPGSGPIDSRNVSYRTPAGPEVARR